MGYALFLTPYVPAKNIYCQVVQLPIPFLPTSTAKLGDILCLVFKPPMAYKSCFCNYLVTNYIELYQIRQIFAYESFVGCIFLLKQRRSPTTIVAGLPLFVCY